ncbi:MAG TPA: glycosyltransferase [Candidatus Marinimicrobia bacterium]|nr:glycosyltransferase [Candidatus Neomarinimicrobiota bacterium]
MAVIIPTFDRQHFLGRAIDSVLSQTRPAHEVIVIDDGSTDGTVPWLKKEYPTVKLIEQTNQGVSAARNAGIQQAQSEWIALLDSDDEWFPEKLERQVKELQKYPEILFCHTDEIWIRKGVRVNPMKKHQKFGGMIFSKCLDICRISPSSALFSRTLLDDVGWFDETLPICEDYDLWLRITAKFPVLFINDPLIIKYGGHRDQLSRSVDGIEQYRITALEKILKGPNLTKTDRSAAVQMLIKKLNIYLTGLKKRGKARQVDEISGKIRHWEKQLTE